ncbi:MAG TPA: hypothetical protein DCY13_09600 [Verrucomicrobiales bacterium]|nr:hypothetical protein [Verrucomicrobiales bacterium]
MNATLMLRHSIAAPLLLCTIGAVSPPEAADRVWSPVELVKEGGDARRDNSTRFRVRFQVASVTRMPTHYPDGTRHEIAHPIPGHNLGGLHGFAQPIPPAVEAALNRLGIDDLEAHFSGATVELEGVVAGSGLDLPGSPTHWTFYISLRSIDQFCGVTRVRDGVGAGQRIESEGSKETKQTD